VAHLSGSGLISNADILHGQDGAPFFEVSRSFERKMAHFRERLDFKHRHFARSRKRIFFEELRS